VVEVKVEPIGGVTSDPERPNTLYAWLILRDLEAASKGEFIVINDAKRRGVKILGQIVDIQNYTRALTGETSRKDLIQSGKTPEDYVSGALSKPQFFTVLAKVKLMYQVLDGGDISSVSTPPADGSLAFKASQESISVALSLKKPNDDEAICIGKLYPSNVEVCFDANRLLGGHIAIFGQTWSGKSYAAGVLIEELVAKGIPVVVIDHMGEYLSLDKTPNGTPSGIKLIKVSPVGGRDYVKITIDPEDLIREPRTLQALGVTEAQLNLLTDAYNEVKNSKGLSGINALRELLRQVPVKSPQATSSQATSKSSTSKSSRPYLYLVGRSYGYMSATIDGLRWKLHLLISRGILGNGYDVRNIVKKGYVTIVDLSEVDDAQVRTLVVANVLSKLLWARKEDLIPPTVVVLEEAHNYVSSDESPSSVLVRDLVRGARHYGLGIVLISQRPAGIHRDAVNVVNTHILFRLKGTDLEYVRQFASLIREEVEEIPLLPEGVAYIAGPIIRGGHAIKVKIRARRTMHGGQSVKFI